MGMISGLQSGQWKHREHGEHKGYTEVMWTLINRRGFGQVVASFGSALIGSSLVSRDGARHGVCAGEPTDHARRHDREELIAMVREVGPTFLNNVHVTGQDGATSIVLDHHRALWVFGDTVTEPFESIRTVDLSRVISSCGMVVRRQPVGAGIARFEYLMDESGKVRPLLEYAADEDPARVRLWPIHGVCVGGKVYLYYHKIELDPRVDVFENFRLLGMGVARADVDQWRFERIESSHGSTLWWKHDQPTYGVWVQELSDGYLYLWGSLMTGMFLARCRASDVEHGDRYEYLDRRDQVVPDEPRWSKSFDPTAVLFDNVPNEMSCHYSPHLKKFIAIHMWNREPRVVMRTASRITGPWSDPITIYEPAKQADDTYYYAAKSHPELSDASGQTFYVTFVDSARYTPRLLEIQLR